MPKTSQYLLKNCIVCGKAFRTARFHTKTCSPACRQKHYRQNKAGKGKQATTENVTVVTLSYLDWLLEKNQPMLMPVAEDWQTR
jgi:predicted nucleic acid-binding Zn ribbon protein